MVWTFICLLDRPESLCLIFTCFLVNLTGIKAFPQKRRQDSWFQASTHRCGKILEWRTVHLIIIVVWNRIRHGGISTCSLEKRTSRNKIYVWPCGGLCKELLCTSRNYTSTFMKTGVFPEFVSFNHFAFNIRLCSNEQYNGFQEFPPINVIIRRKERKDNLCQLVTD